MHKNENGFSVVELIIIIVVLGLVGFSGWWVYTNQQKTATVSTTPTSIAKTQSISPTKSNIKYLNISQWGIRASYASSDTLSYIINTNNSNIAIVISKNLTDNFGCTGTNGLPSGAGIIYRYSANATSETMSTSPETNAQLAQQDPTDYKQIGNYVYGFTHDQAACSNRTETGTSGATASETAENLTNSLIPKFEATPAN